MKQIIKRVLLCLLIGTLFNACKDDAVVQPLTKAQLMLGDWEVASVDVVKKGTSTIIVTAYDGGKTNILLNPDSQGILTLAQNYFYFLKNNTLIETDDFFRAAITGTWAYNEQNSTITIKRILGSKDRLNELNQNVTMKVLSITEGKIQFIATDFITIHIRDFFKTEGYLKPNEDIMYTLVPQDIIP